MEKATVRISSFIGRAGKCILSLLFVGLMFGCVYTTRDLPTKEQLQDLAHPDQLMLGTMFKTQGSGGGDMTPDSIFLGLGWSLNLTEEKDDKKKEKTSDE